MASSSQINYHSHHRFLWKGRELLICLKSGSSVSADSDPQTLVEVTLDLHVKVPIPSPEGGFYGLGGYVAPTTSYWLPVDNHNPSSPSPHHFSTLDASQESIEGPLHAKILELLGPDISRSATEVQGHTGMKMVANAVCFVRGDLDSIIGYQSTLHEGSSEESLGTCTVCLDEIQEESMWLQLECSHFFHVRCIVPWLLRQNSCPSCRSKQPIVMEV